MNIKYMDLHPTSASISNVDKVNQMAGVMWTINNDTHSTLMDCSGEDNWDINNLADDCTVKCGNNCNIKSGADSFIIAGDNCKINAGPNSTVIAGDNCTITTSFGSAHSLGDNCTITTDISVGIFKIKKGNKLAYITKEGVDYYISRTDATLVIQATRDSFGWVRAEITSKGQALLLIDNEDENVKRACELVLEDWKGIV